MRKVALADLRTGSSCVGDVNSTAACAMVGRKLGIPRRPSSRRAEEPRPDDARGIEPPRHRRRSPTCCGLPSPDADENLLAARASGQAAITRGRQHHARQLRAGPPGDRGGGRAGELELERRRLRRASPSTAPSNVDDPRPARPAGRRPDRGAAAAASVFPVHPRTAQAARRRRCSTARRRAGAGQASRSVGYVRFMSLVTGARRRSRSGGIRRRRPIRHPLPDARRNTERPVTIGEGISDRRLSGAAAEPRRARPARARCAARALGRKAGGALRRGLDAARRWRSCRRRRRLIERRCRFGAVGDRPDGRSARPIVEIAAGWSGDEPEWTPER